MTDTSQGEDLAACAAASGCALIDLRFTDLLGRWLGTTLRADMAGDAARGVFVAGSTVAGWGRLDNSDLLLLPEAATRLRDPLATQPTLIVMASAGDAATRTPSPLDARGTLARALAHLGSSGVADELRVGVELEFHLFDDVRFLMSSTECFFRIGERDALDNAGRARDGGNPGHRVGYPSQHLAGAPLDGAVGWRGALLELAARAGLEPLKHQHEAGPSQHEIVLRHAPALVAADRIQIAKYLVLNAAAADGRSATFMPKPLAYQPGSGLHLNLSLWRGGEPLFAGVEGERLARAFIAGVFAHGPALNAICNPGTNSFKRLAALHHPNVPLAWGVANRAAAIRVPRVLDGRSLRLEIRFPDAASNPYLAIAALAMAGLDGVARALDPGPPEEIDPRRRVDGWDVRRRATPCFALDLAEAIVALDGDRRFLTAGGVFADTLIDGLLDELNRQLRVNRALPHPNEYYLYYSV